MLMAETTTTQAGERTQKKVKKQTFFELANEGARTRLFSDSDWNRFEKAWTKAVRFARLGNPFYAEDNAGGVANSYGYSATTARWGVWVDPVTHKAVWSVDRPTISGRHVGCAYSGGNRSYDSDFRKVQEAPSLVIQYAREKGIDLWRIKSVLSEFKDEIRNDCIT